MTADWWEDRGDDSEMLHSGRSGLVVGLVFGSRVEPGWLWSIEHIPSGMTVSGRDKTRAGAKAAAKAALDKARLAWTRRLATG